MSASSSTEPPNADDHVSEPIINEEESRYRSASNVNVSNFVSASPLTKSNYTLWKEQMLCLLDNHNLRGFVDARAHFPPDIKSPAIITQYQTLVKGWIYPSLDEDMHGKVSGYDNNPQGLWKRLERLYNSEEDPADGSSSTESIINEEESWYRCASNVNVSNFVSASPLTKSNYNLWKKQMLCLLDSLKLRGFVDARAHFPPEIKSPDIITQYQSLVKGWIYRSLDEDMHWKVSRYDNVDPRGLWEILDRLYNTEEDSANGDVLEQRVENLPNPEPMEVAIDETRTSRDDSIIICNEKLVKAVVDGRWWEAKRILKDNSRDVATAALKYYYHGFTVLHIAVIEGRNYFLERLLDFIDDDDENIIEVKSDCDGNKNTALHYAARFNNKRAAELLVKKCESLLFCVDHLNRIPLQTAYMNENLDTFLYLWEAVNDEQGNPEAINRTRVQIRKTIDFHIVKDAISTEQYDIALRLVNTFPQVAMQDDRLLMAMARTFPSDLGFGEALICPSVNNFRQRIVKRSSLLLNAPRVMYAWADYVLWATRSLKEARLLLQETVLILLVLPVVVLYPLYQLIRLLILVILYPFFMVYFLLWKVLALIAAFKSSGSWLKIPVVWVFTSIVMPIKRIEKKRKKYQEAKELLNIICNHIDTLGSFDAKQHHPSYRKPFLEAVRQDAYEVVDEILSRSPDLTKYLSGVDDHSFIELAITNRSDKIYNLIYHLKNRMESYGEFVDSSMNNILHLAGRLAPARILSRTTGAALQLQRELQWFQEVEKLMLPKDLVKMNGKMETPHMVFTKEHTHLVKEGEQWMKTTSEACSITAALIVTIVFAAAITVPGGNRQETGIPLFKKEIPFIIFAVCDAISLSSAASALLVFLSILTTRFAEMDFLVSLPRRLIIGLCALFLSTASMMVAFSAILLLVFCDQRLWMLAPIGGLTCMPIAVIVSLQLPLLVDLFKSTYIPIFGKQNYIANGKFISRQPTRGKYI